MNPSRDPFKEKPMPASRLFVALLSLVTVAACTRGPDLDAERELLRQADALYVTTANAGDVSGLTALYAADATRYPPDGAPGTGIDAMRTFAEGVAATPGFQLSPELLELDVSASGDMGYTLNLLELTVTGADGSPATQYLRDFHVWRKEAEGEWRIVVDIWHERVFEDSPPEG
jgi:ketosteroid isomerase-like protein